MAMIMMTELLDFEEQWPRWSGRKDEAIRVRFGVSPARYFQLLHRAIDTLEAVQVNPMLVRRLRDKRREAALRHRRMLA
ncbi:DUF3263 domain-containing protein [Microbacterium enclense]|uniref:DUF3263 domain-containing protein n=1 Tax=Microbacterium enclense TaxID=993073 RepID=UPI0021A8DE41|nr:DUF3263 domain-containing protein [Microbacterium enclense]MCT2086766.1 DUF3263 domain-containing protein [Microbacterium enclense]